MAIIQSKNKQIADLNRDYEALEVYFDKKFDEWLDSMPEEFLETACCDCDGMPELGLTLDLTPLKDGSYLNEIDIVKSVVDQNHMSDSQKLLLE